MDIILAFLTLTCLHYWWKIFQHWYFWYTAVKRYKHLFEESKIDKDSE